MRHRLLYSLIGLVVVLVLVAVTGSKAMFQETGARKVPSLVAALGCRSVLAVFAHPDDEILVAATLADAVKHGCDVRTVTATRGEQGVPMGFSGGRGELIVLRESELRRFGSALGLKEQRLWSFPDGGLADVRIEVLRDSVAEAIRRYRPDLVLTLDPAAGFTGHPDHRRIGEAATMAALQVAKATPRGPRWLARVVFPRRATWLVPNKELRRLLRTQPPADVAVAGNARIKLLGMRIHQTQQRYFPPAWFRPLLYRLLDREHYSLIALVPA